MYEGENGGEGKRNSKQTLHLHDLPNILCLLLQLQLTWLFKQILPIQKKKKLNVAWGPILITQILLNFIYSEYIPY